MDASECCRMLKNGGDHSQRKAEDECFRIFNWISNSSSMRRAMAILSKRHNTIITMTIIITVVWWQGSRKNQSQQSATHTHTLNARRKGDPQHKCCGSEKFPPNHPECSKNDSSILQHSDESIYSVTDVVAFDLITSTNHFPFTVFPSRPFLALLSLSPFLQSILTKTPLI